MRIGFDIDGVWGNFVLKYTQALQELYPNKNLPIVKSISQVQNWKWEKWYPITKEEADQAIIHLSQQTNVWETLECIYEERLFILNDFFCKKKTLSPVFITARFSSEGKGIVDQATRWLENQGITVPIFVVSSVNKVRVCEDLEILTMLEDSPDQLNSFLKEKPLTHIIAQDAPYNRAPHVNGPLPRVDSLYAYLDIVHRMEVSGRLEEIASEFSKKRSLAFH